MASAQSSLDELVDKLYRLRVGVDGTGEARHERPHKPLMLLAALDMLDRQHAAPDRISWDAALRDRFKELFEVVKSANDKCSPALPFYHLSGDELWAPRSAGGAPLEREPRHGDQAVYATIAPAYRHAFADAETRAQLRETLITRYFAQHRGALLRVLEHPTAGEAEGEEPPGRRRKAVSTFEDLRTSAFRRMVIEAYDYQCAACGNRLRLDVPGAKSAPIVIVDAAHLVPFALSHNDAPQNGMALCKNCHWSMDRSLIAPTRSLVWAVSPLLDPRRSKLEGELGRLKGEPVLLPANKEHHPSVAGLAWRERAMLR